MPGRAKGNQVRLPPKTTRPTKSGYGDWSHHRLRCGISRCAARAGLSSRSSSYTSWHEGRRVLRSDGLAVFANTNGTFATIGNRFSFSRARRSCERGRAFGSPGCTTSPPLQRICTALVGTEGSNPVCSSGKLTNYGFRGGSGASAVCSAVPNVQIHLPSSVESANYHSFCHGRWMVNPSEPDPVARGLYSLRGRRGAAT